MNSPNYYASRDVPRSPVAILYLKAYDSVSAARADTAEYINWYNAQRPHSHLERFTPDEKYFGNLPQLKLAASDEQ